MLDKLSSSITEHYFSAMADSQFYLSNFIINIEEYL